MHISAGQKIRKYIIFWCNQKSGVLSVNRLMASALSLSLMRSANIEFRRYLWEMMDWIFIKENSRDYVSLVNKDTANTLPT